MLVSKCVSIGALVYLTTRLPVWGCSTEPLSHRVRVALAFYYGIIRGEGEML